MDAAALIAILFLPIGLFLFIAFRLARRGPWLITWLRGTSVFLNIGICLLLIVTAVEVFRLDGVEIGDVAAEVLIEDAVGEFLITVDSSNASVSALLQGDAVTLSFRSMTFSGPLNSIFEEPLLGLGEIKSRFYDFESETLSRNISLDSTAIDVPLEKRQLTAWGLLSPFSPLLDKIGIHTGHFTVEYIPLQKNAIYDLVWKGTHFKVEPANTEAQKALFLTSSPRA